MPLADENPDRFVDASGYLFLPAGFRLFAHWALTPRPLAEIGDRVFLLAARASGLAMGRTLSATVNGIAAYAAAYQALGETPPAGARERPDHARYRAWIEALPPEAITALRDRLGADLRVLYRPGPRPRRPERSHRAGFCRALAALRAGPPSICNSTGKSCPHRCRRRFRVYHGATLQWTPPR